MHLCKQVSTIRKVKSGRIPSNCCWLSYCHLSWEWCFLNKRKEIIFVWSHLNKYFFRYLLFRMSDIKINKYYTSNIFVFGPIISGTQIFCVLIFCSIFQLVLPATRLRRTCRWNSGCEVGSPFSLFLKILALHIGFFLEHFLVVYIFLGAAAFSLLLYFYISLSYWCWGKTTGESITKLSCYDVMRSSLLHICVLVSW